MRELLQTAGMTEDDRDTVETNLKTVEKESEKEKPRLKLIESSLSSVSSIVESAKGVGSVLIKLAPMLGQALEYARRLFP
jgi:Ulp1 family protease